MTAAASSLCALRKLAPCAVVACCIATGHAHYLHTAATALQEGQPRQALPESAAMETGPVLAPSLTRSGPLLAPPITPAGSPDAPALRVQGDDSTAQTQSIEQLKALANRRVRHGSAAERRTAKAAWTLGLLYLHGTGVPLDRAQAQRWFERAWAMGERWASAGLAWCEIDGCRGPPAPVNARAWISQLTSLDRGRALYLEWLASDRLAPVQLAVPYGSSAQLESASRNRDLLERAAHAGSAGATNELALQDTAAENLQAALERFRSAAARSPAAAANATLLAARMQSADQKNTPPSTASAWLAEARRYHRGDGVPANYTEAIRLYQIAAASGSKPAKRMLEMIYSRPATNGMVDIAWMRQLANLEITDERAVLSVLPTPSPRLFVRDPTPLYDLVPGQWRTEKETGQP